MHLKASPLFLGFLSMEDRTPGDLALRACLYHQTIGSQSIKSDAKVGRLTQTQGALGNLLSARRCMGPVICTAALATVVSEVQHTSQPIGSEVQTHLTVNGSQWLFILQAIKSEVHKRT